jgi:hypothetical protein
LDYVVRSGAGRRFLAACIAEGDIPVPFNSDPLVMAYHAGLTQTSRSLVERIKKVNFDCYLLMLREQHGDTDDG